MAKGLGLDVSTRGDAHAEKSLTDMGKRARDIKRASFAVRTVFRKAEERRFNAAGEGDWPPLAQSTREAKARKGLDPRVLRATGALYRSLTSPRASGQVDERTTDSFRFGTSLPYASFHDTGKGNPKRPLIELNQRDRRQVDDAIAAFVARNETH